MSTISRWQSKVLLVCATLLLLCLIASTASAAPASTPLSLNGSSSGTLNTTHSYDLWSITTSDDGSLKVTVNADSSLCITLQLYDSDGTTVIASDTSGWTASRTLTHAFLQAGTYYVKVSKDSGDFSGNYTISNTLTLLSQANDQEPNDTKDQAVTLPLNGTLTGHLGYFKNGKTDFEDWYKVTTTTDGSLTIDTSGDQTLTGLEMRLYDTDGQRIIAADISGYSTSRTMTRADLQPGTYYIRVDHYSNGYYGGYSISSHFTPQPLPDDQEPNDTKDTANLMTPNSTSYGHLGYYAAGAADFEDWYCITLPSDGKLVVNTSEDESLKGLELFLFDSDGSSQLTADTSGYPVTRSITFPNIKAGTYYVKVDRYADGYYGGYTIENVFTPQPLANDSEPNDTMADAISLAYNTSQTGHLGYFGNRQGDFCDWYKISTSDGSVRVKVTGDPTLTGLEMFLYTGDESLVISDSSGYSNIRQIEKTNLQAGTYYIKIDHYSSGYYGGYTIEYGPNPQPVGTQNYILQVDTIGQGTVSVASGTSYTAGTKVSVTAVAAKGWQFSKWQGDVTGSNNPVEIVMDSNKSITAVFEAVTNQDTNDWNSKYSTLRNQPEAALVVRTGDIDNLNFGWPKGFDPFSGQTTPIHGYPWNVDPTDPPGTDRIMVISSYNGNAPKGIDGYTGSTSRPDNQVTPITMQYDLQGLTVTAAQLQLFVDDFQAPLWGAFYQVTLNGKRATFLEDIINNLNQTGPVGKLITVQLPSSFLPEVSSGCLSVFIDDPVTGAGDGFAIDFVRLLVNPVAGGYQSTGIIQGMVVDVDTNLPVANATISAGSGLVTAVSDAAGQFQLSDVPAGLVSLQVSATGYKTIIQNIDLQAGQTASVSIKLTPATNSMDTTPPKVVSTSPCNGATGVAGGAVVTITFSEDIEEGPCCDEISIVDEHYNTVTADIDFSRNEITLTPLMSLENNTDYTVTVPAEAVQDKAGNELPTDYEFSFSTGGGVPGGGDYHEWESRTVDDPYKKWTIRFSWPLDPETVNDDNIYVVENDTGRRAGVSLNYDNNDRSVVVGPPAGGYESGSYTLYIEKNLRSAKGGPLKKAVKMEFTVTAEPEPVTGKTAVLTHGGFDFSTGEFYEFGDEVSEVPDNFWDRYDGETIGWEPVNGGGWREGVWIRTYPEESVNTVADLGTVFQVSLDSVTDATVYTFPEISPKLEAGHVYVIKLKDGYAKIEVLSLDLESWDVKVRWDFSPNGHFGN